MRAAIMKTSLAFASMAFAFVAYAPHTAQAADGEAPVVVAAPSPDTRAAADDPNIDRGFLLPTAMTQPAGSGTYNNYELLLHGFTYGITDGLQASVTVLAPITTDVPFVGIAALKGQVISTPRFHFALQASAGYGKILDGDSRGSSTLGAGAFGSFCLREDCSSLLSASGTYQIGFGNGDHPQLLIYGVSIVHGVSPHVKLLGELTSLAIDEGSFSTFDNAPGVLASYGVRLHNANFASDIGFIQPIFGDTNGGFVLGLPFASISYRWQ